MRTLGFVALLALVLAGCKKPMPEEALVAMDKAAADCVKCLELVPEKAGPCVGAAGQRKTEARNLIPGPIDDFDEKSVARYDAAEKAFKVCRDGSTGARPK